MVTLSHGATVVVAAFEQIQDPIALLELVKQRAVTIMDLVPSYWRSCTHAVSSLGAEARAAALDNKLRLILSASEPLLSDLPRTWKVEFAHPARLINMFGQTETTGIVSCYPIPDEADDRVTVVSIGRPIANTRVYLLDKHLHPVPIGVVGEVFIGGAGVGRGYLNQPALTAERFIPDPFGRNPGSRLYKTGDLGRYRSDGNLEFLGRRDHQVKIRGARVEIGEIEAVLGQHPDIRQGVVVPRESATGDTRVVAYIVPGRASVPGASELRGFLRQRLPEPMVPSTFVVVNALPLTPTGKVDRRALPAPDHERPAEGAAFVGPRNPLESELALMWEELLNVRPVGIKDNFFDLGGHSLLAIRMLQRIEEVSGTRLPPSVLFDGATVDHLARVLTQADRHDYRSPVVTIQDEGSRTPVFFVTGDYKGGGFYCINLSRYLGTDQPFHVLPCHGFNGDEVPRTVEEMAISHLTGLRAFQPHGPYILGGYCNSALVAFEMARRLQADGEPVELVILIESVMHSDRLRVLHRLLQRLDSWIGLSPERVIRWHYRLKWYGGRLEDVGRLGSRERLALVADRATRGIRALGALGKNGRQREGGPASPAPVRFSNQLADTHEEFVELCHRRAAAGFVPRPYPGRVVLMRAEETALMRSDDPTNGWRRVAEDCEVHSIPGGHVTALTRHTEVVAQKVNACLGRKHEGSSVRCEKLPDGDKSYPNG